MHIYILSGCFCLLTSSCLSFQSTFFVDVVMLLLYLDIHKLVTITCKVQQNKQGQERTLFNETRQYNIQMFNKKIFFKYMTRQLKATERNK